MTFRESFKVVTSGCRAIFVDVAVADMSGDNHHLTRGSFVVVVTTGIHFVTKILSSSLSVQPGWRLQDTD